jgi:hypothetical protein
MLTLPWSGELSVAIARAVENLPSVVSGAYSWNSKFAAATIVRMNL